MSGRDQTYDLFIIGGGINGCGIARDAAGRGYSVYLAEMNDLASGTSSLSTKLVHGGLRYLEFYEFRLVREALEERELLWSNAPHIIWPLRFVLPHHKGLRPAWLLRLGLFLYDHIGGRKRLPATKTLDLTKEEVGAGLNPDLKKGFEYSDCWVDDARLVVLNARDAADRSAVIRTRSQVTDVRWESGCWHVDVYDTLNGSTQTVQARMIVNASGPWVDRVISAASGSNAARKVRLVQGSHIVVPRLFDHDRCYIFQNEDGRICFAIPYENDYTLIGTTDQDFEGDPATARTSDKEITYLCGAISSYLRKPVTPDDVVWTYSGVRPLFDDGASAAQEATRDYVLKLQEDGPGGPWLNIFGGKITTYRRLAESALEKINAALGGRPGPAWTHAAPLPGGDFPATGVKTLAAEISSRYPFLESATVHRLVRLYGTRTYSVLGDAGSKEDLGRVFGRDLSEAEIKYLIRHEWALTEDDVLWRRTKLGLGMSEEDVTALADYMQDKTAIQ
ncbi:MAG: glycerol-3-phosphate dehydrogenase [Alphaproteobacteria bacterium]